jgi:hypothetical protein
MAPLPWTLTPSPPALEVPPEGGLLHPDFRRHLPDRQIVLEQESLGFLDLVGREPIEEPLAGLLVEVARQRLGLKIDRSGEVR